MRIYLASPFFKEEQIYVCRQIEEKAKAVGIELFSPRIETYCPPGSPMAQRKKAFDGNIAGITMADLVLARIDDYDPGTIWELGLAYGMQAEGPTIETVRPIIYCFTTEENRGLNLMLAQSSHGFIKGLKNVLTLLEEISTGGPLTTVEHFWKKEII